METRTLGRTGRRVSAIGLGCWQLGADVSEVSEVDAMAGLLAALTPEQQDALCDVDDRSIRKHVHDRW